MSNVPEKILIGISACLLGSPVRYDGGHKRNEYIEKTLGQFFAYVPYCPEMEIGLGVPREPIRLVMDETNPHKVRARGVKNSKTDVTDKLIAAANDQSPMHKRLSGYIFKKGSPSCGMTRVKLFSGEIPQPKGVGVFARRVMENFPLLPIEEEGRLGDPVLRENFIQRVFVLKRWQQLSGKGMTPNALITFHSRHKLIVMSHSQNDSRALGRLVAGVNRETLKDIADEYISRLMRTLAIKATRGNHVNVLQHIQGYLKNALDGTDKEAMGETIAEYHRGDIPLIVPITLLNHYFRKNPNRFIGESYYMRPYPRNLRLQNEL